jgi:hypothetical protein
MGINLLGVVGLLLYVGTALFLMIPMVRAARRQKQLATWPRVAALVTAHRISSETYVSCREFEVQYEYDGEPYDRWVGSPDWKAESSTVRQRALHVREAVLRGMNKMAPIGAHLPVMINPADPAEAYFVDRQLPAKAIAIASALVFALFFLVFAYLALQ